MPKETKELPALALDQEEQQKLDAEAAKQAQQADEAKGGEDTKEKVAAEETQASEIDAAAIAKELEGWRAGQKRNLELAKQAKEAARAEEAQLKDKLAQVEKDRAEAQKLLKEAQAAIQQASSVGDSATAKKIAKLLVEDGIIEQKQVDGWLQEKGLVKQIDPSEFPTLLRAMAQEEIAKVRAEEEERKAIAELQSAIQTVTTSTTLKAGRIAPLLIATLKAGEAETPEQAAKLLIKEFGKETPPAEDKGSKKKKGEDLPEIIF